ncbi:DUF427 domain-containing protein [Jannaschia seohaensis]|uniref:Uncharacterized conserved protein, DUF427 family n=1 Tax=Jannaschia seohaensis TaxID=475081 RepID=A0A2Y9B3S9_9RHOB|nr:DUF427 domain-containing protein [Jannaschia seohaensis]PWJ13329.1 uncharacterized protein (DUF427 family) [Jannaschia seohaensis]SSA50655.1 Uncharacterized conserved protein, DUF427 family [Jannaschia seohaensis]
MTQIKVSPAKGTWTVRTEDGVLVESRNAKSLVEGGMDPVIYFPREDVAMALLERSDSTTRCPHKGMANYYSYEGAAGSIPDVAWTYEHVTNPDAKDIEGYLAFYVTKVTVEQI